MNSLLMEGLATMLIGMGVVFSFLILTIFSMLIMSKIVGYLNKIFPEAVTETAGVKKNATTSDDSEVAAAIVAAMFKK